MSKVNAEDIKAGMGLKTWFGKHTVVKIEPYIGPFADYALNILVFSSGTKMTNTKNSRYELAET